MGIHALTVTALDPFDCEGQDVRASDQEIARYCFIGPVLAPIGAAAVGAGGGTGLLSTLGFGLGSGALSGLSGTGASSGPVISGGSPLYNDRNYITVAPVGVNLGEILRNFEGPAENGGFGLETQSRMSPTIGASFDILGNKINFATGLLPLLLIAGAAVVFGLLLPR